MNKAQMEMVGLVLTMVLLVFLFLGATLLFGTDSNERVDQFQKTGYVDNLLPALLFSETTCDGMTYRDVFEEMAVSEDGRCESLDQTYRSFLKEDLRRIFSSLEVGERFNYDFRVSVVEPSDAPFSFNISQRCNPNSADFSSEWRFSRARPDWRLSATMNICETGEDL